VRNVKGTFAFFRLKAPTVGVAKQKGLAVRAPALRNKGLLSRVEALTLCLVLKKERLETSPLDNSQTHTFKSKPAHYHPNINNMATV
jgi:hypothetical protein